MAMLELLSETLKLMSFGKHYIVYFVLIFQYEKYWYFAIPASMIYFLMKTYIRYCLTCKNILMMKISLDQWEGSFYWIMHKNWMNLFVKKYSKMTNIWCENFCFVMFLYQSFLFYLSVVSDGNDEDDISLDDAVALHGTSKNWLEHTYPFNACALSLSLTLSLSLSLSLQSDIWYPHWFYGTPQYWKWWVQKWWIR